MPHALALRKTSNVNELTIAVENVKKALREAFEPILLPILNWLADRLGVEEDEQCTMCDGEGVVAVDESDGEGHYMRGVGEQKCLCRLDDCNEDDDR